MRKKMIMKKKLRILLVINLKKIILNKVYFNKIKNYFKSINLNLMLIYLMIN